MQRRRKNVPKLKLPDGVKPSIVSGHFQIITEFNKVYPNIKVEHTQIGGYPDVRDNVLKNIPVNSTPHLAYCYPDHVALYRDARAVEVLDSYISDINYGFTKEQRENLGLSIMELSRKTGISHQNLSRWEANQVAPNIYACMKLADFYGITLDELVGRKL